MGIMEIVLPVAVCFIVTAIAGKLLIPALVKLKAGQSIKEIGPSWHMTKQGTPTMADADDEHPQRRRSRYQQR